MRDWAGKRYWLVGASQGLGRSVALELSKTGAEVILSARDEEALHQLASELPGKSSVVPVDVSDADSVAKAAAAAGKNVCNFIYASSSLSKNSAMLGSKPISPQWRLRRCAIACAATRWTRPGRPRASSAPRRRRWDDLPGMGAGRRARTGHRVPHHPAHRVTATSQGTQRTHPLRKRTHKHA